MKYAFIILCMALPLGRDAFSDTSHEIIPGVKIYDNFDNLEGQLVFVLGRLPKDGGEFPPVHLMRYDFSTKKVTDILQVPQRRIGYSSC